MLPQDNWDCRESLKRKWNYTLRHFARMWLVAGGDLPTHRRCVIIPSSFTWLSSWKERRRRAPSRVGSGADRWSNHVEAIQ